MYRIRRTGRTAATPIPGEDAVWHQAGSLHIDHFRPEGSDHRPETEVRLLYTDTGLFGLFRVRDRYVRCVHTGFNAPVYRDSCVEFFVQPKPDKGYFNFEFNCGGSLLCSYITNHERTAEGFREYTPLREAELSEVIIAHSLPEVVEPEISGPITWSISFFIPFALIGKYAGPPGLIRGQQWRANLFKCGDDTSHPHWASSMPLPEKNFHLPDCFGTIVFE
jgi:hypothetical protein